MGPFVDSEHPLIKQGLVEKTFKQIFLEEVKTRVSRRVLLGALALSHISCPSLCHGVRMLAALISRDISLSVREPMMQVSNYCQEMGDGARVLLIPSCRDAHHDLVFPQVDYRL